MTMTAPGTLVLRDWTLPAGWAPRGDAGALREDPPLFEDPWGVLAPPGGPVSVAVREEDLPGSNPDRHPPTLLLERRSLIRPEATARRMVADSGPVRAGRLREHRVVGTPHGPAALVATRPWLPDGPAVRIVAVLLPAGSRDALVLTLTWDDEGGMEVLHGLMARTLAELRLWIEDEATAIGGPLPDPHTAPPRVGRRVGRFPPPGWRGTLGRGRASRVCGWGTTMTRALLGRTFARAVAAVAVLLVLFFLAVSALAGTMAGQVLTQVVLVGACLLPVLLAWRSWTVLHGLVTDTYDWVRLVPPQQIRAVGLWYYLGSAALLGTVLFGSLTSPSVSVRNTAALVIWLVVHLTLMLLEHGRLLVPRLRERRARRFHTGRA